MGSTFNRPNVVGETAHVLGVGIGPLHGQLNIYALFGACHVRILRAAQIALR